jgi:hypothetical protein
MVTYVKTTLEISDPSSSAPSAARAKPFELREARVDGRGLSPEFETANWGEIRKASYEGRGG